MKKSAGSLLQVRSGKNFTSPDGDSELLLGFAFAASGETAPANEPAGIVRLTLQPLTDQSACEGWWYAGKVDHSLSGAVRLAQCAEFSVLIIDTEESGQANFKALVADTYQQLLTALGTARHTKPIRIWNYFDRINEQQDDEERYRLFSSGRADAFNQFGIADDITPVGTAIGTQGSGKLVIVMLASDVAFQVIENPRQISAYRYPKAYGPDSPKFSRSGLLGAATEPLLLVSGTAAVVGHESAHPFDTARQMNETLINLQVLTQTACLPYFRDTGFRPGNGTVMRVYLRNSADQAMVQQGLVYAWQELPRQILFLRGDVCRSELMIEIEAVIIPD